MNHDVLVIFTSIDLPNQRVGYREQPSSGILGLIVHISTFDHKVYERTAKSEGKDKGKEGK